MSPQEIIYKYEDLIKLVQDHGYIPHSSQGNFGEVKAALQAIDGVKRESSCHGCVTEIIRMASVHLTAYKATLQPSTFHTFPKHEDVTTTGKGEKTNPKKVRKNRSQDSGAE